MQISVKRQNNALHFVAENEDGLTVNLDSTSDSGGHGLGISPMQNLLASLGGCSGIDMQLILGKQRQTADTLEMFITAERQKDVTPALFERIHVLFKLSGELDSTKVKKAADLSMQKFCSVAKILEKTATIEYGVEVNGQSV